MDHSFHAFPPGPAEGSSRTGPQVKVNNKQDGNRSKQDRGAVLEVDHAATLVACSENSAKLTPPPSHVAPRG